MFSLVVLVSGKQEKPEPDESDQTEANEWERYSASGYYHDQYNYHHVGYGGSMPYCDSHHRTLLVGIPRTDTSIPEDIEMRTIHSTAG